MDRLTERTGAQITYIGKHTRLPGLESAGSMRVAATREVMQRLADYEDTGLSPEEIGKIAAIINDTVYKTIQEINEALPRFAAKVLDTLQYMPREQIVKLLQDKLQKN